MDREKLEKRAAELSIEVSKEMTDEELRKKIDEAEQQNLEKGFPTPVALKKEWCSHCEEKELKGDSEQEDVDKAWDEFCKDRGYPAGFPYPYPKQAASGVGEVMFLLDKIIGGAKEPKTVAQQAKAILMKMRGQEYPYPRPYPYPKPKTEEPGADDGKEAKALEKLTQQVASLTKQLEKAQEKGTLRKGLVIEKDEETKTALDKELEGKTEQEQLRILSDLQD